MAQNEGEVRIGQENKGKPPRTSEYIWYWAYILFIPEQTDHSQSTRDYDRNAYDYSQMVTEIPIDYPVWTGHKPPPQEVGH